jgi:hypothetical protein
MQVPTSLKERQHWDNYLDSGYQGQPPHTQQSDIIKLCHCLVWLTTTISFVQAHVNLANILRLETWTRPRHDCQRLHMTAPTVTRIIKNIYGNALSNKGSRPVKQWWRSTIGNTSMIWVAWPTGYRYPGQFESVPITMKMHQRGLLRLGKDLIAR